MPPKNNSFQARWRTRILQIAWLVIFFPFAHSSALAQVDSIKKAIETVQAIPHENTHDKWLWPHRSIVLFIMKEHKNHFDTTYIRSYKKSFVITLPVSTRYMGFSLIDWETRNRLIFSPNYHYDLAFSISSRWASVLVNTGLVLFDNHKDTKGKTTYADYQFNIYGNRLTTDAYYQDYRGFYIKNSQSFATYTSTAPYQVRSDVHARLAGVSTYYILNNKRFSYRNSFAFNEIQKKSAGSLLLGFYYSLFSELGNTPLVTDPFRPEFSKQAFIRDGSVNTFGINVGYIYTLVFLKKCYVTASLVPGIGAEVTNYTREDESSYSSPLNLASKINIRLASGYDAGNYFIGTMWMYDYYFFASQSNSTFNFNFGKFRVFVGYRFHVDKAERRLLKKMNLIDYKN
jgi:hypothetical protein